MRAGVNSRAFGYREVPEGDWLDGDGQPGCGTRLYVVTQSPLAYLWRSGRI